MFDEPAIDISESNAIQPVYKMDKTDDKELIERDWLDFSTQENLIMLQNYMSMDEVDLSYNLQTTHDPLEL